MLVSCSSDLAALRMAGLKANTKGSNRTGQAARQGEAHVVPCFRKGCRNARLAARPADLDHLRMRDRHMHAMSVCCIVACHWA